MLQQLQFLHVAPHRTEVKTSELPVAESPYARRMHRQSGCKVPQWADPAAEVGPHTFHCCAIDDSKPHLQLLPGLLHPKALIFPGPQLLI